MLYVPSEKRRAERRDFPLPCQVWIDRGNGARLLACSIEDVSKDGARLKLRAKDISLPSTFVLRLSLRDQTGKPCVVRWRRGAWVGIQYVSRRG